MSKFNGSELAQKRFGFNYMGKLRLPDPKEFRRGELTQRWGCDLSRIDAYIEYGQLKLGFDTTRENWLWTDPRKLNYYKSEAGNEQLLDAIEQHQPLSSFMSSSPQEERIISCPQYLYLPVVRNTIMKLYPVMNQDWPDSRGSTIVKLYPVMIQNPSDSRDTSEEVCSKPYIWFRYFYDLEGNALIPMSKTGIIEFPQLKHRLDLLRVPLEEVERFEGDFEASDNETGIVFGMRASRSKAHELKREGKFPGRANIARIDFALSPLSRIKSLEDIENEPEGLSSEACIKRTNKKTRPVAVEIEREKAVSKQPECLMTESHQEFSHTPKRAGREQGDSNTLSRSTTDKTAADKQHPPSKRLLRLPEVRTRVSISRAQIYKLMNEGRFPKSVKLTERTVAWRESEIDAWIEEKERDDN